MKPLTAKQLIEAYLKFFKDRGHTIIPSASLVPEGDASTLFIIAGIQPLVPYFLGEPHPSGKRLVNVQRCLRTEDIEEVGNADKHTFFQMLGNWSLGDYFKQESIAWSFEFLTKVLEIDPAKLHITVFEGDAVAPKDEESKKIWLSVGIPEERIYPKGKWFNWWEAGPVGPGGPDTEIYFDTGKPPCGPECNPTCKCGKYFEIWNNVFIEYNRKANGTYEPLKQKNVDTGMGVERTAAILQGKNDNYLTETWQPIISEIKKLSGKSYNPTPSNQQLAISNQRSFRIIADHIRAAVFVISDGVTPAKTERGYILRRLIRRAVRFGRMLGITENFAAKVGEKVVETYHDLYPDLSLTSQTTLTTLTDEESSFRKTLEVGLRHFEKLSCKVCDKTISGTQAFDLYQSYGFPLELTEEMALEKGFSVDLEGFKKEFESHQDKSRTAAKGFFKGGMAERSEETKKLHTATHLLNQALREVLKDQNIKQMGSNITPERLRFDFNFDRKLEVEETKAVEDWVNQKIVADLPVCFETMTVDEAKKKGAQAQFAGKYEEKIKVYLIGNPEDPCSTEICGGPHTASTGELKSFKIIKEEAVGKGVRRIKAVLS